MVTYIADMATVLCHPHLEMMQKASLLCLASAASAAEVAEIAASVASVALLLQVQTRVLKWHILNYNSLQTLVIHHW